MKAPAPSSSPESAATRGPDDEIETVRVPALRAADSVATVPVGPASAKADPDLQIPPSPRVPFTLTPRTTRSGRWRADVVAEWVKLSAADSRRE